MNLTKRATAWFLTLVMILGLVSQTVFAEETTDLPLQTSLLQYEVLQEINKDKTESAISLEFTETETIQLEKVTLPDGTEKTENFAVIAYTVSENGKYEFVVDYFKDKQLKLVKLYVLYVYLSIHGWKRKQKRKFQQKKRKILLMLKQLLICCKLREILIRFPVRMN